MTLKQGDYIVLKIGTECLRQRDQNRVNEDVFLHVCEKVAQLYEQGYMPLIVSSGAVFMGMERRGLEKRPVNQVELQSLAARGQYHLMRLYEHHFGNNGFGAAQILVTHRDLKDIKYRRNLVEVAVECLRNREIPVFNENDAISNEELRRESRGKTYHFDDNDMLSYLIARYFEARFDVMFNRKGGLYTEDGTLIHEVRGDDFKKIVAMTRQRGKSKIGRGGLRTKIKALKGCTKNGIIGIMIHEKYLVDPDLSLLDMITQEGLDKTVFYPEKGVS